MSNKLPRKAALLVGLTIFMSGVCDANAATTTPVTDLIFPFSVLGPESVVTLSFPQFNPSLGTLTGVDFSLSSTITGGGTAGTWFASVTPIPSNNVPIATTVNNGPFDFTDFSGLVSGLTTADYSGNGNISVSLTLADIFFPMSPPTWSGNGADPGLLTLFYDYTPVAPTPIPTTLPLFAGGLGFVGYLARRRKRSGKKVLAAA